MKFSTNPTVMKPVAKKEEVLPSVESLLSAQCYMNQIWTALDVAHDRLTDIGGVIDNINITVNAIEKYGTDAIKVLNLDKSLENLTGLEEKFITADKALEGLGEALKNAWEQFKEWVKKIALFIRNWIGKVFQTSGHQMRTVSENIDKVDFDTKLYVIDFEHLRAVPDIITGMLATIHAWMGKYNGYKDISNLTGVDELTNLNRPFLDRLAMAAHNSGGIFVFDKDTGKMELNIGTFVKKEQSLAEGGWTKDNLKQLCNPVWSKSMYQFADEYYKYSTALVSMALDATKAVIPSETVRAYITASKAYTQSMMSCLRAFMAYNHLMADVANQAYKTLPEELKKRVG